MSQTKFFYEKLALTTENSSKYYAEDLNYPLTPLTPDIDGKEVEPG